MPALTLKYRPIQYVDDVFKGEGRNIGVITYGSGNSYFRCLGDANDDKIDVAPFARLSKAARLNSWLFAEWAAWFKALVHDCQDRDIKLQEYLQRLDEDGAPFIAGNESVIEIPEGGAAVDAVSWLYSRLVREPKTNRGDFHASLEGLLIKSELEHTDGFEKDVEIEFTPEGLPSVRISADFILSGKTNAIFKVLRFKGSREHLMKRVNDVIFTFQQAISHGFTSKPYCFALTDTPTSSHDDLYKSIVGAGTVLDITKENSAMSLERIIKGRKGL
ncbi:MAG: hypothetical protein FIA89_13075 [Geobacter sp.]|nr:hypothetical protein [Geobacter sp.]